MYLCKDQIFEHGLKGYTLAKRDRYFNDIFGFQYSVKSFAYTPDQKQTASHPKIAEKRRKTNKQIIHEGLERMKVEDLSLGRKDLQPIIFEEVFKTERENMVIHTETEISPIGTNISQKTVRNFPT